MQSLQHTLIGQRALQQARRAALQLRGAVARELAERQIGSAFLWQPSAEQWQLLRQDWEELMELISLGGLANIRGAHGKVLQLRPKAANSKALTEAVGAGGEPIQALPRGFYLKASFTAAIVRQQFS